MLFDQELREETGYTIHEQLTRVFDDYSRQLSRMFALHAQPYKATRVFFSSGSCTDNPR